MPTPKRKPVLVGCLIAAGAFGALFASWLFYACWQLKGLLSPPAAVPLTLQGKVVDFDTGMPVPGAQVCLTADYHTGGLGGSSHDSTQAELQPVDAAGSFSITIPSVSGGDMLFDVDVCAFHAGYYDYHPLIARDAYARPVGGLVTESELRIRKERAASLPTGTGRLDLRNDQDPHFVVTPNQKIRPSADGAPFDFSLVYEACKTQECEEAGNWFAISSYLPATGYRFLSRIDSADEPRATTSPDASDPAALGNVAYVPDVLDLSRVTSADLARVTFGRQVVFKTALPKRGLGGWHRPNRQPILAVRARDGRYALIQLLDNDFTWIVQPDGSPDVYGGPPHLCECKSGR